jgi:hypothetical protein
MIKNLLTGIAITIAIGSIAYFLLMKYGDPTISWTTYVNTTYGFTLRYPQGLELTVKPINVEQARLVYDEFCQTHEGCGGARWPEFVLNFETEEKMSVFMVDIYQIPMDLKLGEKINANFTFLVREPYNIYYFQELKDIPRRFVNAQTLKYIQESIRFIPPDLPLACLWNNVYKPAIPPEYRSQVEYVGKIASISGYYFQKQSGSCMETSYDTWIYDVENTTPPFPSVSLCETTCLPKR